MNGKENRTKEVLDRAKPILKGMLSSKTNQGQPRNVIEAQKKKNEDLKEQLKLVNNLIEFEDKLYAQFQEGNKEAEKANDFCRLQIEEEKKKQEKTEEEEKLATYTEEFLIEEKKKQINNNLNEIQKLKDSCIILQTELNVQQYRLNDLQQKRSSYQTKINFSLIELKDKMELKSKKENQKQSLETNYKNTELYIKELEKIDECYVDYQRFLHNLYQESKGNIRVFCRVRPPLKKEASQPLSQIDYPKYNSIIIHGPPQKSNTGKNKDVQLTESYKFDHVFQPNESQEDVFKEISQLVQSALDGYKVCIFAYGQTGSGKTYTMEGEAGDKRGMIPRSIEKIFDFKKSLEVIGWEFTITVSCCEIYVDQIRDLLLHDINNVIKGDKLIQIPLKSIEDWEKVHELAKNKRSVAETMCNEKSSRSHCIFQININGRNINNNSERKGALNLIDLAGSERISKSKVEDERLKETISINKSLTALKSVITALVNSGTNQKTYIPYRDSVLTFHLQSYLGGDSKTLMFVNISPILSSFSESSSSLKFAADVNACYLQTEE